MGQADQNRQKAIELGALDAEELIAAVPYLARLLSKDQVAHFQKVLDAAVLNPMYQDRYKKALKEAKISSGPLIYYDKAKKRRANRIRNRQVSVSESDQYIRVDHHKMLTADALVSRTNNPDEANYLAKVRHILNSKGIWLRLKQPWGSGLDPRVWAFSFTLGHNGDIIKTDDALINREELLRTLGGYYDAVTTGPILTELQRQVSRLRLAHENGESLHELHAKFRREAFPGVVGTSDLLGGADFPSTKIWELPFELRSKAMDAITETNIWKAKIFLVASALVVEANGMALAEYAKDTIRGGERAVIALKVIVVAGAVAEVVLTLGATGVIKFAGKKALTQAAKRRGLKQLEKDYYEWEMKHGVGRGLTEAEVRAVQRVRTFQDSSTKLGSGMKAGQSHGGGTGFHKGY